MERLLGYISRNRDTQDALEARNLIAKRIMENLGLTYNGVNIRGQIIDKKTPILTDHILRLEMMENYTQETDSINGHILYPICGNDDLYIKLAGLKPFDNWEYGGFINTRIQILMQKIRTRKLTEEEYEYLSKKSGGEIMSDILENVIKELEI